MGALFGVDAGIGQAQALDWPSADQVLGDDFGGVRRLDVSLPDRLGVNHHDWAVLALIQAQGLVNAGRPTKAGCPRKQLQFRDQVALSIRGA